MNSRRVPAMVALLALLASGCATVPQSSDVQVLRSVPAVPQVDPVAGPTPGASPFRLVRDFIEATGSPADGHAAARAFLTREAAATWDDDAILTVIEDSPDTPQSGPVSDVDSSSVVVRAARMGTLAADGSFTPESGLSTVVLDLVRENGEWRISNPPPGVLVESTAFQQNYRKVTPWFVEPTGGTLVPDLRWVPAQPDDTLVGRALDALLGGPSDALANAVVSAIPPGARPRSNVLIGRDGRPEIDLAGMGAVGEQERRVAAAQIVSTLEGLVRPPYRLLADGEPLVPGKPDWRAADIASYTAASTPRPDVPGLVVYDGRLRGLDGAPLPGVAGSGELQVLTAARSSPEGQRLAAVAARSDGRPQMYVGTVGQNLTPVALDAATMTRPTWRSSGNEVWTVIDGRTVAGIALSDSAAPTTYQVNAAELAQLGPISDLRLSRDGVRVAAIVGGELVVATVVSGPGEVSIQQPQVLRPASHPPFMAVDWARADQLVVASSEPSPLVAEVSVDGLLYRPMSSTNLTAPLAGVVAAPGREVVVADANGLWTYSGSQEVWEPLLGGIGPGVVPLYPG